MNALEKLEAVLCDPEGKCCIGGSDADRQIVNESLAAIRAELTGAQPVQPAPQVVQEPVAWMLKGVEDRPFLNHAAAVSQQEYYRGGGIDTEIITLIAAPQAVQEPMADIPEALQLLSDVFDAWENGIPCNEEDGGYIGMAFQIDDDVFHRCCNLLNRRNPPRNATPIPTSAQPVQPAIMTNTMHEAVYRAIDKLDDDGDEHGVAADLRHALSRVALQPDGVIPSDGMDGITLGTKK